MVKKNESDKSEEKSTLSTEQMDVPASFWNTHDHEALIEQFLAELVEEQTSENFISNESPEESPAKYNEDIDVASELSFITEHLFNPPPVHGTPGSSYSTTHPHNIPYTDDLPVFGAHTVIADWYQPEGIR
uniref:NAC domain-containing protein n=1 Tax=Setaria digitata TaxID=48799 RepID=A0A915Q3A6_9BILA